MAASKFWTITIFGCLSIGQSLGGTARGADLLPPPPPDAPVAIGDGWYLRVDATVSDYARPRDASLPPAGSPPLVRLNLDPVPSYGGGVGYRINDWLRVDATVDQRIGSRYSAYSSGSNFRTGYNVEAGELDVLTGLVNVYADLGTWWGLTPYIGAGIGFADKGFGKAYTQTTCLSAFCDGNPGTGLRDRVRRPSHSVTSLAWALTGGVSYAVGNGFSIDTSYRYVDLGRARTGTDAYGFDSRLKDLASHEVRVGLRYSFASGPGPLADLSLPRWNRNPYE
ncbi:outer membrane protein [Methylobacterium sp. J-068]|uniref:outer membrane protein n=1 Tax=Methylobacterium sp. J-068 TaxID=2836649 RepID=UPI001FB9ABB1|nr:outer membrane beta-barrel protein [Methylobacterium sp. J-068]MCJ2033627.1 outer membrane beta-barrel protein [Methylobacterium sp. J-068]